MSQDACVRDFTFTFLYKAERGYIIYTSFFSFIIGVYTLKKFHSVYKCIVIDFGHSCSIYTLSGSPVKKTLSQPSVSVRDSYVWMMFPWKTTPYVRFSSAMLFFKSMFPDIPTRNIKQMTRLLIMYSFKIKRKAWLRPLATEGDSSARIVISMAFWYSLCQANKTLKVTHVRHVS